MRSPVLLFSKHGSDPSGFVERGNFFCHLSNYCALIFLWKVMHQEACSCVCALSLSLTRACTHTHTHTVSGSCLFCFHVCHCQIMNVNFSFIPLLLEVHIEYKLSITINTFCFYSYYNTVGWIRIKLEVHILLILLGFICGVE